ncbi:disease resistance protein RUN1-like [Cornus florida]|uniref:disease resistance protein RUN1-like n=1 Tax=Cornus florida TaxID=4283 RepID=UPI0028973E30|nr:disease resistance protein RUN1-like [Cornus florida]
MDKNITISYPDRGINEIKERLHNKRLLLVLDDVDKENILKYLVGEAGEECEAVELFSWHAFKQNKTKEEYEKLSHHAKDYAKGLPLALKVLGSYLSNRSKQDCLTILNGLQTKPPKEIHEVLRISYESLDKEEKNIFLDIACFFKGYNKKYVLDVSKRPESDKAFGIEILRERCLINISKNNHLSMHDLIQEMGREIVCQESDDLRRRNRLWSYEDIYEVFTENTGTENIEGIVLLEKGLSLEDVDFFEGRLHVSINALAKMRKLRILKISGVELHECHKYLSHELRFPFMEKLLLRGCESLVEVGFDDKKCPEFHREMICLEHVWFNGTAIKELPPSVGHLEGLDELHLWNSKMLGSLDNIGEMKSLRMLVLSHSVIKKLPSSIAQLSIVELHWCNCNLDEESFVNLPHSLWKLDLSGNDFLAYGQPSLNLQTFINLFWTIV